ncbi:MAG: DUF2848 domain-containing protein [Hyphomicrobiaceae bacterium]
MAHLTFDCISADGVRTRSFYARNLVLAGWTGRDREALQHHIDELAELGIPGPTTTPMFYRCGVGLVTQTPVLQVLGPDTSGEVEYVLIAMDDGLWVTVGSDQTDRRQEAAIGIAMSKQLGGKVLAREAWRVDEVAMHWDQIALRAWVTIGGERVPYQDATLGQIKSPLDLISGWTGGGSSLPDGTIMMGGTPAAIGGVRPAARFEMELSDPVLGRSITAGYDIETLQVIA